MVNTYPACVSIANMLGLCKKFTDESITVNRETATVMNEYVAEDKNKQQYMDLMNTELIDRY